MHIVMQNVPCTPKCRSLPIYERYDFVTQGGKFMDANIPHRHMIPDFRTAPP